MLEVLMKRWRDKLACPVCSSRPALQPISSEGEGEARPRAFRCASCNREFPVIEGIPHIIATSAKLPEADSAAKASES